MSRSWRYFKVTGVEMIDRCEDWLADRNRTRKSWARWTEKVTGQKLFVATDTRYCGIPVDKVPAAIRGEFKKTPQRAGDGSHYLIPMKKSELRKQIDALPTAPAQVGTADEWIGWNREDNWFIGGTCITWNRKTFYICLPLGRFSNHQPDKDQRKAWATFPVPTGCVEVTPAEYEMAFMEEKTKRSKRKGVDE